MPRPSAPPSPAEWWSIFDPRISLRARATLLVLVGCVAFAALVGWLGSSVFRRQLEQHAGAHFETLAVQLGDKIDRALIERHRALQLAASLEAFQGPGTPAAKRDALEATQVAVPDFVWIGFADANGQVLSATQRRFENTSVAEQPWFHSARTTPFVRGPQPFPELAAATPEIDDEAPRRFFDLALPVTGPTGRLSGILGSHLRWGWVRDLQLSVVPESAKREQLGVSLYSTNDELLHDSGGIAWSHPPGAPALPETRRFRGAMIESTSDGAAFLTGYYRTRGLREFRGLGLLIVVRQPLPLILEPVRDFQRAVGRWAFAFTILLASLTWWRTGKLIERFRHVGTAAERIREGDVLSVMPGARGDAEIDHMCQQVRELVEEIRPKHRPIDLVEPPLAKPTVSPTERIQRSV